jgi:hypothetical protein
VTFVRFLLILIFVISYLNVGVEVNSRNVIANQDFRFSEESLCNSIKLGRFISDCINVQFYVIVAGSGVA